MVDDKLLSDLFNVSDEKTSESPESKSTISKKSAPKKQTSSGSTRKSSVRKSRTSISSATEQKSKIKSKGPKITPEITTHISLTHDPGHLNLDIKYCEKPNENENIGAVQKSINAALLNSLKDLF